MTPALLLRPDEVVEFRTRVLLFAVMRPGPDESVGWRMVMFRSEPDESAGWRLAMPRSEPGELVEWRLAMPRFEPGEPVEWRMAMPQPGPDEPVEWRMAVVSRRSAPRSQRSVVRSIVMGEAV